MLFLLLYDSSSWLDALVLDLVHLGSCDLVRALERGPLVIVHYYSMVKSGACRPYDLSLFPAAPHGVPRQHRVGHQGAQQARALFTNSTKHFDVRFFRILQGIDTKEIVLHWVDTETEVADVMTKPLCRIKHKRLMDAILDAQLDSRCR
jgi:hypothetical protein